MQQAGLRHHEGHPASGARLPTTCVRAAGAVLDSGKYACDVVLAGLELSITFEVHTTSGDVVEAVLMTKTQQTGPARAVRRAGQGHPLSVGQPCASLQPGQRDQRRVGPPQLGDRAAINESLISFGITLTSSDWDVT